MGCGPTHGSAQAPGVRESPVVWRLARVRTSGACRTSVDSARVDFSRTSGRGQTSGRRLSVGRRKSVVFGSGVEASVIRRGADVWSLEVVGRLEFVGRPEPGDFEQFFFLSHELGVLTVLSVECSWSVAFLQVPDHT